jgi:hypothetical protein
MSETSTDTTGVGADKAGSPAGAAGAPTDLAGAPTGPAGAPTDTSGPPAAGAVPSEEELRAAYEAELSRITSADLVLQTAASLLNLGARRLGLTGARAGTETERDLEQVRDAIDGVRGLMPVLERRSASEIGPLRDALSQLQMAYAREAQGGAPKQEPAGEAAPQQPPPTKGPGPAEASGRLWVPGR